MWVGVCFNRVSMFVHRPSALRTTISGISSGRRPSLTYRTCLLLCRLPRSGYSGRMYQLIWPRCATKRLRSLSRLWKTAVGHNKIKIQVNTYYCITRLPELDSNVVVYLLYYFIFFGYTYQSWTARGYWPECSHMSLRNQTGKTYSGPACRPAKAIRPYHWHIRCVVLYVYVIK